MKSDEELLALLDSSPEEGMEELIDRCSGLVWSIVKRRLENDEDARECVNDTFLEFYRRRGDVDLKRGSVELFIGILARSIAINRYRSNTRSLSSGESEDLPDPCDLIGSAESRLDVESAIAGLGPEDARLIRMRYYGDMSLHEIAESMGIPYETVKKRHQRSLKKLRSILTAGLALLIALLLAACAYLILRRFGIIPGIGAVDMDAECYLLDEEITASAESFRVYVEEAVWLDGSLTVTGAVVPGPELEKELESDPMSLSRIEELASPGILSDGNEVGFSSVSFGRDGGKYGFELRADLPEPKSGGVSLILGGCQADLALSRAKKDDVDRRSLALTQYGGIMARARRTEDGLFVDIYTLNTGEYTICPLLIYDFHHQNRAGDMVLKGPGGAEYTGEWTYNPSAVNDTVSTWSFGDIPAGEYELKLPCVYVGIPEPEGWSFPGIPLDLKALTWSADPADTGVGKLTITGVEEGPASSVPEKLGPSDAVPIFPEDAAGFYISLKWESDSGLELVSLPVEVCAVVDGIDRSLDVTQYQSLPVDGALTVFAMDEWGVGDAVESSLLRPAFPITVMLPEPVSISLNIPAGD